MRKRISNPEISSLEGFPQTKKNPPDGGFYLTAM
jgi:hypothetical protein